MKRLDALLPIRSAPILVLAALVHVQLSAAQTPLIHGFADVNYLFTEREVDDGFYLGQFVGHAAVGLTEHLAVFSEVSLTGHTNEYTIELERLVLRYDFFDQLKISAGRYHTPVSYWNTAFHHGLWLQTTVGRPQYTRFGSMFVPIHFVGLLAEGNLPTNELSPGYFIGVGNGRSASLARAGDSGDVNDHRAWLAGVYVRPALIYGLQAGVSIYRDRIEQNVPVNETILSAHVVWAKESPEIIAELAQVTHSPVDGPGDTVRNYAYYVQAAYRLPQPWRRFKPYARLEWIDSPSEDPVFGALQMEYDAMLVGIRYDFSMLAALKLEYRNEQFAGADRTNSLYIQASFTFPGANMGAP